MQWRRCLDASLQQRLAVPGPCTPPVTRVTNTLVGRAGSTSTARKCEPTVHARWYGRTCGHHRCPASKQPITAAYALLCREPSDLLSYYFMSHSSTQSIPSVAHPAESANTASTKQKDGLSASAPAFVPSGSPRTAADVILCGSRLYCLI